MFVQKRVSRLRLKCGRKMPAAKNVAKGTKGLTAAGKNAKPKTSMTVEGSNVVDLSDKTKAPKVPPAPLSPIPQDDAFTKMRTQQA